MDIAFDNFIVHQPVNDISRFTFSRTDDGRVKQEMALINEAIDADAFALSEILERVISIERLDGHLELLTVTGSVKSVGIAPVNVRQVELIQDAQDAIISRMNVRQGEVPVDGAVQFVFINLL